MTPNEVITEVRRLIQDTRTPYRYSDAVLLGFGMAGIYAGPRKG